MAKIPRLRNPFNRKQSADGTKALDRARDFIRGDAAAGEGETSPVRITNDSVAKHREEVLKGARRFIYPLKHSKHRIAIISTFIVAVVFLVLVTFTWYLLYRQQSIGNFAYRISQIVPFPVARVEGQFVRYEEYLFELRQNVHYLSNQENVDFTTAEGASQLEGLRRQAMEKVVDNVIIRRLAGEKGITVSNQEIEEQIDLIRSQGGIGSAEQTLEDTLQDFYGWSLGDLRRVIRQQVLKQKLIPQLDIEARPRAEAILNDINSGADFAKSAAKNSDDEFSRDEGGDLGFIFRSNTELPPQIVEKAFSLAAGEVAGELVETLFGYHIVKNIEYRTPDEAKVAHILVRFKDIESFIGERRANLNPSIFITLPAESPPAVP